MSHKDYLAKCDEDQLRTLIEMANARLETIRQSGWTKLWAVSIDWATVAWFPEHDYEAAAAWACRAAHAEALQKRGRGVELALKLEKFRPEEVADLLLSTQKLVTAGAGPDTERLDFLVSASAWIHWRRDGTCCAVFHHDAECDGAPIMGQAPEAWAATPREAIDKAKAMVGAKQQSTQRS
jgi:hypothetical protein